MSSTLQAPPPVCGGPGGGAPAAPGARPRRERRAKRRASSLFANGEPMVWLTGGALSLSLCMIAGLLVLVIWQGAGTFWPSRVVEVETLTGQRLAGEISAAETYSPAETSFDALGDAARAVAIANLDAAGGRARREMLRTGNFDLTGSHFHWVSDVETAKRSHPEWMLVVERLSWGRFYGTPKSLRVDGAPVAEGPRSTWDAFRERHDAVRERFEELTRLKTVEIGRLNSRSEAARLEARGAELAHGIDSPQAVAAQAHAASVESNTAAEYEAVRLRIEELDRENARTRLVVVTADGVEQELPLDSIVRAYPANRLGVFERLGIYLSRWVEYLTEEPREANSEGGVFPAIFGTIAMTLIMTIVVVPFGVLAALYLREYAKPGPVVSFVRIAINNLAGVPSIVFGVFGLGFFCYIVGAQIDSTFFAANLPNPTFGKGGLLWASLTLALLTLPVVIVPTEEALSAVPSSMREGSYACGATKWQTIRRIVLPRAMPGIMTGAILALARGAGEVAPLMLVGAVKLAPSLPIDGDAPFLHPERSFMHLGFHIFDLGFQSQNSEAAKPMVYTTTLLLIAIVVVLNLLAIWIRARLRSRFSGVHV